MKRALLLLTLAACDDGASATVDAEALDGPHASDVRPLLDRRLRDAGPPSDARIYPDARRWPPRPAPRGTDEIAAPEGWRWARGLIHLHSPLSHDACDGEPRPGGVYDAECLADLRFGLCFDRHDFAFLTDHSDSFAEHETLAETLWLRPTDDAILGAEGTPIASRWACPDGHRVILTAGFESALMPVMLTRKPAPELHRHDDAETAAALRDDHGALVLQAHLEARDIEQLRAIGLDGVEIYNLHANLDPDGMYWNELVAALRDWLPAGFEGGHPDLAFLAVVRPIAPSVDAWDALLPHQRLTGFAGSDIHQNTNILPTHDGERLDSYRRLGGWFSNYLLVRDRTLPELRAALKEGRVLVAFDALGHPDGVDFAAVRADGTRVEMGGATPLDATTRLTFQVSSPDPIQVRLFRVDEEGRTLVLETDGPFVHEPLARGAYRVEVYRTPVSLAPELGIVADTFVRPTIWLYTNPIYVE